MYPKLTKEEIDRMMQFYEVDTLEGLLEAQTYHIEKLQAKLPAFRINTPLSRVREG